MLARGFLPWNSGEFFCPPPPNPLHILVMSNEMKWWHRTLWRLPGCLTHGYDGEEEQIYLVGEAQQVP